MKNKAFISLFIFSSAVFLMSGCSEPVNTVERASPMGNPSYVDDMRVVRDQGLDRTIMIQSVNQSTVSGDMLKVQVNLRNTSRYGKTLRYTFEWYDLDGMQVTSATDVWKVRNIIGGESFSISAVAPNPRAVDFRLKLRDGK